MAALTTLILLPLASSVAFATNFFNCDAGIAVESVDITYCDNTVPLCNLFSGQEYALNVTFKPDQSVDLFTAFLTVTLSPITGEIPILFQKVLDNSCKILSFPIQQGVPTDFTCSDKIPDVQTGDYMSEIKLDDDQGHNWFCTQVEVAIF